jgi:hypothetical protein
LVRFLILMATSCGLKTPHTITRPNLLSIWWLSSSAQECSAGEGKGRDSLRDQDSGEVECLFTSDLEERPSDPLVAPVAVDVHPQHHAVLENSLTGTSPPSASKFQKHDSA